MADARQRSMSNAPKYKDRTAEQREADAKLNGPKYVRARVVNAILTAKYLKAKSIFDNYYAYDVDAAFDATSGTWLDEADPWLRFRETLPEFLEEYTHIIVESDGQITVEGLQNLSVALIRVARAELEGAGRDKKVLDKAFEEQILGLVKRLKTEYKLPEAPDEVEDADEDDEE